MQQVRGTGYDGENYLDLPVGIADGIQTRKLGSTSYRVYIQTISTGERISILQATSFRDEIAQDSALRTVTPLLILVPILILLVGILIPHMLKAVTKITADITHRGINQLHPITAENIPDEIQPFVDGINHLLIKIAQSMSLQRRFIADAAHELRSPLAALLLQAEHLGNADLPETAQARLATLRLGIERSSLLVTQLLALARAQSDSGKKIEECSLLKVIRVALEDLLPLAEAKNIDIGIITDTDSMVLANDISLLTLLRNLVDNAIRYTPWGGKIDLSIQLTTTGLLFKVEDNGPGIPLQKHKRVFEPFYRIAGQGKTGSGLGLSISHVIAEQIGAKITLGFTDSASQTGLAVTVTFLSPSRN